MTLRFTEEEYAALIKRRQAGCAKARPSSPVSDDGLRPRGTIAPKPEPSGLSPTAELFAAQLTNAVIPFVREYRFAPPRRFRFDFVLLPLCLRLAVEIDGGVHRIDARWRADREKGNLALQNGWRVYHFQRDQARSGEALATIRGALQQNAIRTCN